MDQYRVLLTLFIHFDCFIDPGNLDASSRGAPASNREAYVTDGSRRSQR
jgi:hypothetical protein